jgi:hypothetical protein
MRTKTTKTNGNPLAEDYPGQHIDGPDTMPARWIVRCRVSGGVTGTRESVCKRNDAILYFDTEATARAYVQQRLTECSKNSSARFQYWPELADGGAL